MHGLVACAVTTSSAHIRQLCTGRMQGDLEEGSRRYRTGLGRAGRVRAQGFPRRQATQIAVQTINPPQRPNRTACRLRRTGAPGPASHTQVMTARQLFAVRPSRRSQNRISLSKRAIEMRTIIHTRFDEPRMPVAYAKDSRVGEGNQQEAAGMSVLLLATICRNRRCGIFTIA